MEGKWYVRVNSAELDSYAVVKLTADEVKVVTKFLAAEPVADMDFCGKCYLIHHGFDTKEEALESIATSAIWLYLE